MGDLSEEIKARLTNKANVCTRALTKVLRSKNISRMVVWTIEVYEYDYDSWTLSKNMEEGTVMGYRSLTKHLRSQKGGREGPTSKHNF